MASRGRKLSIACLSAAALLASFSSAISAPLSTTYLGTERPQASPFFQMPALPVSFPDITAKRPSQFPLIMGSAAGLTSIAYTASNPAKARNVSLATRTNPLSATRTQNRESGLFDSVAVPFKRLSALTRFAPSFREIKEAPSIHCSATACSAVTTPGNAVKVNAPGSSLRDRMNLINVAINRSVQYRQDMDTYGVLDRWATPLETLSRLKGDCEDFAILKMAALHSYGFELEDMSLVIVFDQKRRFYHAVLSVELGGRNYILDNLSNQVRLDRQLPDYVPLYSVRNGKGFLHGSRDKTKAVAGIAMGDIVPGQGLPQVGG